VFLRNYNIFCSKNETSFKISEIYNIEIVLRGSKRAQTDTTRYYIKLTMINNQSLIFGKSVSFLSISQKVIKSLNKFQKCVALLRGVLIEKVNQGFVVDESEKSM
jgi:hypothetical protein